MGRTRAATRRKRSYVSSARRRLGDLLEESHVRIVENANVGNSVSADGDARRSHAERPARIALAVEPRGFEDRRVNHARAEDLDPSGPLARGTAGAAANATLHVHLGGRFGEREVARTKASLRGAKEPFGESIERRLQVDKADALVNAQAFDLSERRCVRGIEEVSSIDGSGNEHTNRRLVALERTNLNRRRVRPEQP